MESLTPVQRRLVSDAITTRYAELAAKKQAYLDQAAKHKTCHEEFSEHCQEEAAELTAAMATLDDAHQVIYFGISVRP